MEAVGILTFGMFVSFFPSLGNGHIVENFQAYGDDYPSCITVEETRSVLLLYTASGFQDGNFSNRTDFEIYLNNDLVGAVTTAKQRNTFNHNKLSRLSSYPTWQVTFDFTVIEAVWQSSQLGYNYILNLTYKNTPATFDGVVLRLDDSKFVASDTDRSGIALEARTLNVKECVLPEEAKGWTDWTFVDGRKSCTFGCRGYSRCLFGPDPYGYDSGPFNYYVCTSNCEWKPPVYCPKIQSEGVGTDVVIIAAAAAVVVIVCAAGLAFFRFKKGKWPWMRANDAKKAEEDESSKPAAAAV